MPCVEEEVHVLGQGLAAERVRVSGVGHVGQLYLEAPPVGSVSELSLGTRGVRGSHDARVHRRGRGPHRVHEARANAARRIEGPVRLRRIHNRVGCAHEEVGDHRVLLRRAHRREGRVGRNALAHEGGDARHLCRGLGRACFVVVLVARLRRCHTATGRGDFRLQPEIRIHAPRGGIPRGQAPLPLIVRSENGCHRQDGRICSRRTNRTHLGGESPPFSASVITSRRYNRHSRVGEPVIGPLVESYRIATNIAVRHERHGDSVWPDHHRIVQGCQQVAVTRDVPGVRDNLRDNELSLRRSAPIRFVVGGGEASHTSAMHVPRIAFTVMLVTDQYIRVAVRIVIDEGDLVADPRAPLASPKARCQGCHVRLGEAQ